MAENESLVLGDPYAWRWKAVSEAVRKGQPAEKVAKRAERKLHEGLRKALRQLAEKGISLEMLLESKESPRTLQRLLKQSEGHDYLSLFAQTALTKPDCGTQNFSRLSLVASGIRCLIRLPRTSLALSVGPTS